MNRRLEDLIDIEQFQMLQDRLSEIYAFPAAIIDNDGRILTATCWQKICTEFHRKNPECEKECIKSDQYILEHLTGANPTVAYRCPHGLVDTATPIIIDGVHMANFFTGQFFLEKPDLEFFRSQARRFEFNEADYIEAVRQVPVWNQAQLDSYLFYIKGLIELISASGLRALREMEATRKMEESENQFKAIFEMASIGIAQADINSGRFLIVNQKMCEITGYTSAELACLQISDITHADDRQRDWVLFQSVVDGETPNYRLEKRYVRKDASVVWVNVNMTVIRDDSGKPLRTIATIEDITDRKRVEGDLRASEERYRTLFDRANDGIFVLSIDGTLVELNETFAQMHGYTAKEMVGMRLEDLDTPETSRLVPERMRRLLAGEALTFDVEHFHKDGHVFPLEVSASLINYNGRQFIQCFHRDISRRKADEAEKERLEAQLRQAMKMEAVGRLAGGVAHDFNNMLSVILGHAELALTSTDPNQPLSADLREIRIAAERSADLTRQLLTFARQQVITPTVLDLNLAIESMLKMLRRLIGENINLEWRPYKKAWPVKMDPTQIDQILANLCVNSRDAITGVGTIRIETENVVLSRSDCVGHADAIPGEFALLKVTDSGRGMDRETLSRLFEPFFTTKEVGKGTGLGLATVYGIITQNHGFINVVSNPNRGTTFKIFLPRFRGDSEAVGTTRQELLQRGDEVILLVEDEPAILHMTATMLERLGYSVMSAAKPREAVHLVAQYQGKIDLLVTDVVMPELNGRDLAETLTDYQPTLKCLFTSGYTADVIAPHGVLGKGVNFLQKPYQLKELAAKVRQALDGTPPIPDLESHS